MLWDVGRACSALSPGPGSLGIHTSSKLKSTQANQLKKLHMVGVTRKGAEISQGWNHPKRYMQEVRVEWGAGGICVRKE